MEITQSFLNQLPLQDKAAIVCGHHFWFTHENLKYGIKKVMMTDGPSGFRKQSSSGDALGINNSVQAVSFPASALTACSFDRRSIEALGEHLGQAARAEQISLLLGPGVNIKRGPLAGRNFEYFSEDPYLTGEMGVAYVNGVQSQHVGVSVKHFAANNRENQRFTASSDVDERSLREIYLAAFEKIVKKAAPATLMCSYNALNGTLNSQNHWLLTDVLRQEWGFDGLVMSDWGAVADHTAAIKAGLDLEMPGKGAESEQEIIDAVHDGTLDEHQLDNSVRRVLRTVHQWPAPESSMDYDLEEQHQFARQLAANSMVLLKNKNQTLPIDRNETVAVLGELAVKPRFQGGGSSHVNAYRVSIPYEEISQRSNAIYGQGYQLADETTHEALIEQALEVAKDADKVIIFAGYPESYESEGFDKQKMTLPTNQIELIKAVSQMGKPVVVVLQNGSAVEMPWIDQVSAVLETYLAGETVGEATADVLYGDVNPSGKLAETFPLRLEDNPTFGTFGTDHDHERYHEGIYVGYRYYDVKQKNVLFPFGYGLSYTKFDYQNLRIRVTGNRVRVQFDVTNVGDQSGQAVAEIYVANQVSEVEKPIRELKNFDKVDLAPGETRTVTVVLTDRDLSWYNQDQGRWQCDAGNYAIQIGTSSRNWVLYQVIKFTPIRQSHVQITENTYVGELQKYPELQSALIDSGLDAVIQRVAQESDSARLLENMPLRAGVMIGIDRAMVSRFLQLANQNNGYNG